MQITNNLYPKLDQKQFQMLHPGMQSHCFNYVLSQRFGNEPYKLKNGVGVG
jgi:hypothetical protein